MDNIVEPTTSIEQINSAVDSSFFYTNDRQFHQMDMDNILKTIVERYPGINPNHTVAEIKRTVLMFLQNDAFVTELLSSYRITIYDVFRAFCSEYDTIFKGSYLKKVKKELSSHDYAKSAFVV